MTDDKRVEEVARELERLCVSRGWTETSCHVLKLVEEAEKKARVDELTNLLAELEGK